MEAISVSLQGCAFTDLHTRAWPAPQRRTRARVARGARRCRVWTLHNRRENAGEVDEHGAGQHRSAPVVPQLGLLESGVRMRCVGSTRGGAQACSAYRCDGRRNALAPKDIGDVGKGRALAVGDVGQGRALAVALGALGCVCTSASTRRVKNHSPVSFCYHRPYYHSQWRQTCRQDTPSTRPKHPRGSQAVGGVRQGLGRARDVLR